MKKTLLIAAAALAASLISSQAQVYSQNVVGYANISTTQVGANYLLAVPFKVGVSNGANEVFGSALPDFSTISTWSVAGNSYTVYYSDSGSPSGWDDVNFGPVGAPIIPVGQGFFLEPVQQCHEYHCWHGCGQRGNLECDAAPVCRCQLFGWLCGSLRWFGH